MYKVIAFDVDGTLVKETSSWVTIHKHFGTENFALDNLRLYEAKKIDYPTFMKRDIDLWPKPSHIDEIEDILSKYTLVSTATNVIKNLQDKGYEIVLISAGIDLLVKKVATDLDVSVFRANGLEVNNEKKLTGNGIFKVDLLKKENALADVLNSLNCKSEHCVSIGDSKYDKTMLEYSGYGIALGKGEHQESADHKINDLSEILDVL